MGAIDNISGRQFNTDRILTAQGNPDEAVMHRGYQSMTSNVYKPPFANMLGVTENPSTARADEEED